MISGRKTESAHTAFPARYVEDFREADQTFLAAANRDRGERVPVTCVSLPFVTLVLHPQAESMEELTSWACREQTQRERRPSEA